MKISVHAVYSITCIKSHPRLLVIITVIVTDNDNLNCTCTGDRLNFAVDLSSGLSDRFNHLFILTARANYGSGYASLPWHFRFKTDPEDECGESVYNII